MDIEEFLGLITNAGLISSLLNERDVIVSYNLAMMTQVDEITSMRHMKMIMIEFLEAIARCADSASMPPPGSIEEEWPREKRMGQSLVKKIEHMLLVLLLQCQKEFINHYKWPAKDQWGLFTTAKFQISPSKSFVSG